MKTIDSIKQFGNYVNDAMAYLHSSHRENLSWYSWPHLFGNSNGPHSGLISLQVMTEFQVYGFRDKISGACIKVCDGVWKDWDGNVGGW